MSSYHIINTAWLNQNKRNKCILHAPMVGLIFDGVLFPPGDVVPSPLQPTVVWFYSSPSFILSYRSQEDINEISSSSSGHDVRLG